VCCKSLHASLFQCCFFEWASVGLLTKHSWVTQPAVGLVQASRRPSTRCVMGSRVASRSSRPLRSFAFADKALLLLLLLLLRGAEVCSMTFFFLVFLGLSLGHFFLVVGGLYSITALLGLRIFFCFTLCGNGGGAEGRRRRLETRPDPETPPPFAVESGQGFGPITPPMEFGRHESRLISPFNKPFGKKCFPVLLFVMMMSLDVHDQPDHIDQPARQSQHAAMAHSPQTCPDPNLTSCQFRCCKPSGPVNNQA